METRQLRVSCNAELYKNKIFKAIVANDVNKVKELLLSNNNYLYAQDNNGHTPLHVSIITNNKEILDLLLQQEGVDVNALSYSGNSPLLLSLFLKGDENLILRIIDANCDVNTSNTIKETALHIAARHGYTAVGEVLIKKGADINAKDVSQFTPLHEACCNSHLEFVQLLLRYDADTTVKCYSHLTAFMMAVNNAYNQQIAFELLEKELCLNNITIDGYSTLLLSINSFNPISFELIERGADVNHVAPDGRCSLELALFWKNSKLYNSIFPKFDKKLLEVKFMETFFEYCEFPGDEWGLCAIDLLNHTSPQLFLKYFKQNPVEWTLRSRNVPAKIRMELIERFLSLNIPINIHAAFEVYNKYGHNEEMEAILKRNIRYSLKRKHMFSQNAVLYDPIFYGAVFIHEDLKGLLAENLNCNRTGNIVKFINLSQTKVPLLVELSRDASRNFIKTSCHYRSGSLTCHQFLDSLMLPQKVKDIIRLKIPLYS